MASADKDLAAATDFSAQQFSKEEVANKVVEQYDDAKTRLFYQIVMGARSAPLPRLRLLPRAHAATLRAADGSPHGAHPTPGGGGHDIHYGIFRAPSDGVRESSAASTAFMMSCMDWARPVRARTKLPLLLLLRVRRPCRARASGGAAPAPAWREKGTAKWPSLSDARRARR
jgi:hypothetical protein